VISRKGRVGVIGATSIIGEFLLPLLVEDGYDVMAFSRRDIKSEKRKNVRWQMISFSKSTVISDINEGKIQIALWVCLAPVNALTEFLPVFLTYGARKIVVVSSTSLFTKKSSADLGEKKLAEKIADNENTFVRWAAKAKVSFTVLRPTMIYGRGRDKNVNFIASFIRWFSFFCIPGKAEGLRSPIHAQDVAMACKAALGSEKVANRFYNISGGEVLTYREMVCRIFSAMGKKPRFLSLPERFFRPAIFLLRLLPPFRQLSVAMLDRMNQDLVFDNAEAIRDLNFSPRSFRPDADDLKRERERE